MKATMSVWIHGPQGCGKTLNGQRLARALGLVRVVEADELPARTEILAGTLVLSNDLPAAPHARQVRVLSFDEAMRATGFTRRVSDR